MSEQLPTSMIHPEAPEFFSAMALYNAPIDVEETAKNIRTLWNEEVNFYWDDVEGGKILRFTLENVLVLLSPIPEPMVPEKGSLPPHRFHVAITCFAPLDISHIPGAVPESETRFGGPDSLSGAKDSHSTASASPASGSALSKGISSVDEVGLARRRRALAAHVVLTELADALMRQEAAVGLFRPDLGVVQPPQMVVELADTLSKGQAPLPLWVGIRTQKHALGFGRTLGLNLFGHLDLEVLDSPRSEEDIYAMLANIADYIISSSTYILPGQSVGYRQGEELMVTQEISPADGAQVLRIAF